jgi:hypothetical protein
LFYRFIEMSEIQGYVEIPLAELSVHATTILNALINVCESASFRTSPKSCEFLRHIVQRSINGEADELKERLIGMSLLGREATYDTGSDAGVRVRANDVRKRLMTYNKASKDISSILFVLPSGSYVPRFYRTLAELPQTGTQVQRNNIVVDDYQAIHPLSLQRLAVPTCVALFLCVMCLRWQIAQEHPFTTFWQGVFQNGRVLLYLPPATTAGTSQLIGRQELEASVPLLNLAGQFRSQVALTEEPEDTDKATLIAVGADNSDAIPNSRGRLMVENTVSGRKIIDRRSLSSLPNVTGSAALLTIQNTPHLRITIDGTDSASVQSLVRLLCEHDSFPDALVDNNQAEGTTQFVFPMSPRSDPIVFHDPANASQSSERANDEHGN